MPFRVGIVGGGISGCSVALELSRLGIQCTLIEKQDCLVKGPPWSHIHAGGAFYREISDEQCFQLLEESIYSMRRFPFAINKTPTVIAVPVSDGGELKPILERFERIQKRYSQLVVDDPANAVMGPPEDYFKVYHREEMLCLKERSANDISHPLRHEDWMVSVAKMIDFKMMKFPMVLVQEYSWIWLRVAAFMDLILPTTCDVLLNTEVNDLKQNSNGSNGFEIWTDTNLVFEVDYLINAAGFKSGWIDDKLNVQRTRMLEYKASYICKWENSIFELPLPEIVFHGPRGTDQGMAQFTPWENGVVQLHGMTKGITLFENSIAISSAHSAQPELDFCLKKRIYQGWEEEEMSEHTYRAITHMTRFIPSFESAKFAGPPLDGAQQIAGKDKSRRAYPGSFVDEVENYARVEIVKASSALTMSRMVVKRILKSIPEIFAEGVEEKWEIDLPSGIDLDTIVHASEARAISNGLPIQLCFPSTKYCTTSKHAKKNWKSVRFLGGCGCICF